MEEERKQQSYCMLCGIFLCSNSLSTSLPTSLKHMVRAIIMHENYFNGIFGTDSRTMLCSTTEFLNCSIIALCSLSQIDFICYFSKILSYKK